MTNPNQYATPVNYNGKTYGGMTIRATIAKDMMAALLINRPYPLTMERVAKDALAATDALISELNKPQSNEVQ